jgi:hypothetical protein
VKLSLRRGGPRDSTLSTYLDWRFPDLHCGGWLRFIAPRFAGRPHEKRNVGLRNCEAGRIDRRGERGFAYSPQEPSTEFLPLKAQRRLQPRLEKPVPLLRGEPRPALHRGLKQISVPHLAIFQNENSANETQKSKNANMLRARGGAAEGDMPQGTRRPIAGGPRQRVITSTVTTTMSAHAAKRTSHRACEL